MGAAGGAPALQFIFVEFVAVGPIAIVADQTGTNGIFSQIEPLIVQRLARAQQPIKTPGLPPPLRCRGCRASAPLAVTLQLLAQPTLNGCREVPNPRLTILSECYDHVHVIRHQHRRENLPITKTSSSMFECGEGVLVCQHRPALHHAHRDEVDNRLFRPQPNRYARRMCHSNKMAGGAPALQQRITRSAAATIVAQAHRLPSYGGSETEEGRRAVAIGGYSPSGCLASKPRGWRGVGCQRGAQFRSIFIVLYEVVSRRRPAISAKVWPLRA